MSSDAFIDWWRRQRLTAPRINEVMLFDQRTAVPDQLPRHCIALVSHEPTKPKWVVFQCPCGYGHQIALNLQRSLSPSWRLDLTSRGPSIFPSIDVRESRRCHFWLRHGHVVWVRSNTD